MDVLKLTDKDLFKLRLYDDPIVIDASMYVGKWAGPGEADHLKTLGVIEKNDDGLLVVTHPLRVLIQSVNEDEPSWKDIKKGTVLGRKSNPERKYS